jgi:hypothetical protein
VFDLDENHFYQTVMDNRSDYVLLCIPAKRRRI